MVLLGRIAILFVVLLGASAAGAEIYRWTDAQGRVHFTQDLSRVPAAQRSAAEAGAGAAPERGRLQTYPSSQPARAARSAAGTAQAPPAVYRVPVARAGTGMIVDVRLNNAVTAPFLVDTGASDVLIPKAVADRLGLGHDAETRTKVYSTANGQVTQKAVMLRSVNLGGAIVENVPASISPSMSVGLLGLSFFNHFTYNVDAAAGVVTLVPNQLAETGGIRGGRSEAQWRAEYRNIRARITSTVAERERKPESRGREHARLRDQQRELERQLALLEGEADHARVPMSWRD